MKNYITFIKDFFEPKFISYEIKLPVNEVLHKFGETLNAESTTNNSQALKGSITDKEFVMSLISIDVQQPNFSAALRGTISECKSRQTRIDVYILRDSSTYLTFFFSIIGALIYFIMYYSNPDNIKALFWGLGILILGTSFSIWFSNSSVRTLQNKFEIFLKNIGVSIENCC